MNDYLVIYEKTATGYSAYVPDLSGCISTGPDVHQTQLNMQEAIAGHLSVMREFGDPTPEPTTLAGRIAVPAEVQPAA